MSVGQEAASVVVDTCVISFLEKGDTRAEDYEPHLEGKTLVLSFMTVAELERWALVRGWGAKRRGRLEELLQRRFVVYNEMSRDLCGMWAEVSNERSRKGHEIGCADAWIAATALLLDIPLVTNNVKDFDEIDGLVLLSAP